MTPPSLRILAVGATGSIGRHVVDQGLRAGHRVRALVRHPAKARLPAGAEVVVGDLTRLDTLEPALEGINAIVFTHGGSSGLVGVEAVDYGGIRNVLLALRGRHVRIALMTAIGVTDRKGTHDWKRRGERLLRASGLPYTIVRPGWFDYNDPDQRRLVLLQGDKRQSGTPRDGAVARSQLAQVLLHSLISTEALSKTFELVAERGDATADYDGLFSTVEADAAGALDGIHDLANMPLEKEPSIVQTEVEQVRSARA